MGGLGRLGGGGEVGGGWLGFVGVEGEGEVIHLEGRDLEVENGGGKYEE